MIIDFITGRLFCRTNGNPHSATAPAAANPVASEVNTDTVSRDKFCLHTLNYGPEGLGANTVLSPRTPVQSITCREEKGRALSSSPQTPPTHLSMPDYLNHGPFFNHSKKRSGTTHTHTTHRVMFDRAGEEMVTNVFLSILHCLGGNANVVVVFLFLCGGGGPLGTTEQTSQHHHSMIY